MTTEHTLMMNFLFILFGVLFSFAEKINPERKINYLVDAKWDVLSLLMIVFCGELVAKPLMMFFETGNYLNFRFLYFESSILKVLLATLVLDFINYGVHYFMHFSPAYWKTHIYHHRIENLYWFSGLRASLGHILSFLVTRITIGVLVFKLNSFELLVYFCIPMILNSFQHTNANIGHRWIEWILISPRAHRLHHSSSGSRIKNIGSIFSFWDRMFSTYCDPEVYGKNYELGLAQKNPKVKFREIIGV